MKKRMGVLATLITVVLGLAGCGIQDSTQPPENSISVSRRAVKPLLRAKVAFKAGRVQKGR